MRRTRIKNEQEEKLSIIEKFIYKMFIGIVLLTTIVCLDCFKLIDIKEIQSGMSNHFNFLEVIKKINGSAQIIPIEIDEAMTVDASSLESEEYNGGLKIFLDGKGDILNYYPGVVVKITKDDGMYTVTIKGANDYLYRYENIEELNCHIYQYLAGKEVVGKTTNEYYLYVYNDDEQMTFN